MAPINVKIQRVIDLAIGTSEDGIVNFNLIHSLLYVFAQRLDILDKEMKFDGTEAALVKNMLSNSNSDYSVEINIVDDENVLKPLKKITSRKKISSSSGDLRSKQPASHTKIPKKASATKTNSSSALNTISEESSEETVSKQLSESEKLESSHEIAEFELLKMSQPHLSSSDTSKSDNDDEHVLKSDNDDEPVNSSSHISKIFSNCELINEIRSRSGLKSVSDMCQLLNQTARLEAAEAAIKKLSNVVEDLILEYKHVKDLIGNVEDVPEKIQSDIESGSNQRRSTTSICGSIANLSTLSITINDGVKSLSNDYLEFKMECQESISSIRCNETSEIGSLIQQQTSRLDTILHNQINVMFDKINDLDYRVTEHIKSFGDNDMMELILKLNDMDKHIDDINEIKSKSIQNEQEQHENNQFILAEVEDLKSKCVDRNYLYECMRDKVDKSAFQYDLNKISINIHDTITKLDNQEYIFRGLIKNIEVSVMNKLDRDDILSLKAFYDSKIEDIYDKIEKIEIIRIETEAAITSRYVRDANCITCGRTVIMSRIDSSPPFKVFEPIFKPFNKLSKQRENMSNKGLFNNKSFNNVQMKNDRKKNLIRMNNKPIDQYCSDHEPKKYISQSTQYLMWDIQTDPSAFINFAALSLTEQFTQMTPPIVQTPIPNLEIFTNNNSATIITSMPSKEITHGSTQMTSPDVQTTINTSTLKTITSNVEIVITSSKEITSGVFGDSEKKEVIENTNQNDNNLKIQSVSNINLDDITENVT